MENLKLIEPNILFEAEYHQMLQEWVHAGESLIPYPLRYDATDFAKLISQLKGYKTGIGVPESFVPNSTFWLVNDQHKILGVVTIRHRLTDALLKEGGHIGYGVRPLERKKGYATKILEFALLEAKKIGIDKALVTCDKDNIGSMKTILKNNGKLFEEYSLGGVVKCSFWIEVV